MSRYISLCFFAFLLLSFRTGAQTLQDAKKYYDNKSYQEALSIYQNILEGGLHSTSLYFNMGNCYYRMEQWGRAIAYYEKAKRLSPSDSDIDFNLKLALKTRPYQVEGEVSILQNWWERLLFLLPLELWMIGALVFAWLAVVFLYFYFYKSAFGIKRWSFSFGVITIFVCFLFLFFGIRLEDKLDKSQAIVVIENGYVKTEPNDQSSNYFTVYEGMKVDVLSDQEKWLKILISDGKVGWISENAVQRI